MIRNLKGVTIILIEAKTTGKNYMTVKKKEKDYCTANDQKNVVEKMTDCDTNSKTDKEKGECYSKVVADDNGCMSS